MLLFYLAGNVWLFNIKPCTAEMATVNTTINCYTTNATFTDDPVYCDDLIIGTVFIGTLVRWGLLAIVILGCCSVCCPICCVYHCVSTNGRKSGVNNKGYSNE